MKLPTILGKQLIGDMLKARMEDPTAAYQAVAAFQRMALTADFETSLDSVKPWLLPEHRQFHSHELAKLKAVYNVTKNDVLGHAIDSMLEMMDGQGATKDKLAAAAVINELFGEKHVITDSKLTDRLMINLADKL